MYTKSIFPVVLNSTVLNTMQNDSRNPTQHNVNTGYNSWHLDGFLNFPPTTLSDLRTDSTS